MSKPVKILKSGMTGTGTDTRMYAPRSESSHLFRNNHEDEASVYSPEDGKYKDERMEKKKRKRKEREAEMKRLKHIRVKPSDLPPSEDEEEEDEDLEPTKFDNELEPSLMTGTHGNFGAMTSMANQARGPGFAGGHDFAMGAPMDMAWRLLKSDWDHLQAMYPNTPGDEVLDRLIDDFGEDGEEVPFGGYGPNGDTAYWLDDIMGEVSQGTTWSPQDGDGYGWQNPEELRRQNREDPDYFQSPILDTVHHGTDKQFNSNSTDEERLRHGLDLYPHVMERMYDWDMNGMPDWRASDNIAQWAVGDQWHGSTYGLKTIQKHFPDMEKDDIQRVLREHAKGNDQYGNAYPDYSRQPHEDDSHLEDLKYTNDEDDGHPEWGMAGVEWDSNGEPVATGEPMDMAWQLLKRDERQGFVGAGKKPRKKKTSKQRKEHKERQKKWRPSTGEFKRPPGGMTPGSATSRRAKARMRGIKGGKKTGLSRAHLAVEMSHRGVKTKQPMSKDPRRYRQYLGQQEARKRLGNIRTVAATPSRFGGRSYRAGLTGGGTLQSLLPGQGGQMRRPSLRAHRPPPLVPPRVSGMPKLPQLGIPSPPPIPQASRGVGVQNMAGQGAMYTPSRVPTASVQGGYPSPSPPASIMMGKVGVGSDLQKRGLSYYDMAELRQLVNDARKAMKRKDNKRKGKGEKSVDAASHLPAHTEAGPKRTTRNEGGTEDETDPRTFGINPLDHLTSRGGRTP